MFKFADQNHFQFSQISFQNKIFRTCFNAERQAKAMFDGEISIRELFLPYFYLGSQISKAESYSISSIFRYSFEFRFFCLRRN